jgi:hypothetical protein
MALNEKGHKTMRTPIGQTPAFESKWQALMRQLETVLSIAHRREPNATETAEAVSIAQYHMQGIADLLNNTTPEG